MENYENMLPNFPLEKDMWEYLAEEKRPIVVYGMGNGADKLIRRFEKYGIIISDFFASDGFVRGHSFHGKRVKSFSEIKSEYNDFIIVLSFASSRDDVIMMLEEIDSEYEMVVPDMPVADEEEYFDKEFYNLHYNEIHAAFSSFADEESKIIFASIIKYKLFGKLSYLKEAFVTKEKMYSLLPCRSIELMVDAGAYNGDTAREAKAYFSNLKKIVAIEPDNRNFKKLMKYCEAENEISIDPINGAVWCRSEVGSFYGSGNRNSTVSATASYEHKTIDVRMIAIDDLNLDGVDYIKYDVEGAEHEALLGTHNTINSGKPSLLVSAYHRSRDIYLLVNYLREKYPFYNLYLRRLRCIPAWELNILAVPTDQSPVSRLS